MAGRLSIGSGRTRREGWRTLDANPSVGADITATLPPLPAEVRGVEWEAIELIHIIEHFFEWEAVALLGEIHEVLTPGGVLILEQPNIEYCARVLLGLELPPRGAPGQFDMWGFYGDPNHRDPLMCHHWGYSPATLSAALVAAGFELHQIAERPARHHCPMRDFRLEATR